MFHKLKTYDAHLIIQKLGKFDFKMNGIPNGLEKYMSFSLDNKLVFVDSFKFWSYSLDNLVTNLGGIEFGHLGKEFDNEILDLVKQKGCYPYESMSNFEQFNFYTADLFRSSFFSEEDQFDPHFSI